MAQSTQDEMDGAMINATNEMFRNLECTRELMRILAETRKPNWAHVGSAKHIAKLLAEINDHLAA